MTTVNYCRSNNIPVAVRGKGAHSPYGIGGSSDCRSDRPHEDDFGPGRCAKKLAFIQAGADGGDVDHEVALHNLILYHRRSFHTGFAGVALEQSMGHLSRWLGAVADSIVGYEMVALGKVVRVDEPETR